jgi:hypothetical protein
MKTAEIIIRSQHAKRGRSGFAGPDCYITVIERSADSEPVGSHPLTAHNYERYGWTEHYIGKAYSRSTGPRSIHAALMARARVTSQAIERDNVLAAEFLAQWQANQVSVAA